MSKVVPTTVKLRQSGQRRSLLTHSGHLVVQGNVGTSQVDLLTAPDCTLRVGEGAGLHKEITNGNGAFLQVSISDEDFELALDANVDASASMAIPAVGAASRKQQLRVQVLNPTHTTIEERGPGTLLFEAFAPGCLVDRSILCVAGSYKADVGYFFAAYFDNDVVAVWIGHDRDCYLLSVVDVSPSAMSAVPAPEVTAAAAVTASTVAPAAPPAAASVVQSAAVAATPAPVLVIGPTVPKSGIAIEMTDSSLFVVDGKTRDLTTIRLAEFTTTPANVRDRVAAAANRHTSVQELTRLFSGSHSLTKTQVHSKPISKLAISADGQKLTVATDQPKVLHTHTFTAIGDAAFAPVKIVEHGHQRRWSNVVNGNRCLFALGGAANEIVAAVDELPDKHGHATLHVFNSDVKDDTLMGGNFLTSLSLELAGPEIVDSIVVIPKQIVASADTANDAAAAAAGDWILVATSKIVIAVAVVKTGSRTALQVDRIWKLVAA